MIDRVNHGPIRELRLNRPPANALSPEVLTELAMAGREAPTQDARAIVLSGSPGLFTGGLDVPLLLELDPPAFAGALEAFFGAMDALATSTVPVVAAITGHSPAGGAVLALFCDWRIMAEGPFVIGFHEVKIGIPMPRVVAEALARTVGPRRAEELCVTGRLVSGADAVELGLVDAVAAADAVVSEACRWCEEVISVPARGLGLTRATLRRDLVETIRGNQREDIRVLCEEWFKPEVQGPLRHLAARLAGDED